jgi:hypothetical protein
MLSIGTFRFFTKNVIFTVLLNLHLYVCMWSQTYYGDLHSSWWHNSAMIRLFDPQHPLFELFKSFPSLDVNYNGVSGSSSSSIGVPSFYYTNTSWFASYFKIGNSYSSWSIIFIFRPFFARGFYLWILVHFACSQ